MYQIKNKRWFPLQAATVPSLWASTTHSPQGLLHQGYLGQQWSTERLQSHREIDAQFCHSQNCVTSNGSSPPWAHTASTMNYVTSDGSPPSLGPHCLQWELENTEVLQEFWLEILKPSAVPYWKLLWSGVFWDSKSCNFQKMNIRHFRKIWNTTDLLS